MKCDFCSHDVDRLWCWKVRPVCALMDAKHRMQYEGGAWRACVYCRPLVEDRDAIALAARVAIILRLPAEMPLERLYTVVFAAIECELSQWAAGEVLPK